VLRRMGVRFVVNAWEVCIFVVWSLTLCRAIFPSWSVLAASDEPTPPLPEIFFSSRNVKNDVTHLKRHFVGSAQRFSWSRSSARTPDTTVVLLNWSRPQNVILQASVYCGPLLQDIVEKVVVWNNQPTIKLAYSEVSMKSLMPPCSELVSTKKQIAFLQCGLHSSETPDPQFSIQLILPGTLHGLYGL
jgi:hypothetical protein